MRFVCQTFTAGPLRGNSTAQCVRERRGSRILEIVDAENASHVWAEHFETDRQALDEALRALDETPLEFLGRSREQLLN